MAQINTLKERIKSYEDLTDYKLMPKVPVIIVLNGRSFRKCTPCHSIGPDAQNKLGPILNGLVGLVQGEGDQPLEVEEARSTAFLAICEVGKALHRGQPADSLWASAIAATERWKSLGG